MCAFGGYLNIPCTAPRTYVNADALVGVGSVRDLRVVEQFVHTVTVEVCLVSAGSKVAVELACDEDNEVVACIGVSGICVCS
jgi:hypothetical protein